MQILKLNEIELACKNLYGAIGEFESRQKLTDECIERAEKNSELGRQLKTWIRAKMEWELFGPHCEALLKRGGWFEHCTPDNRNKIPKR